MRIIESIYLLLDWFYSDSLREYLLGFDCSEQTYVAANVYSQIGLWTLGIVAVVLLVYYKLFDPTGSKITKWLITMAASAVLSFAWAVFLMMSNERKGLIGECLLRDEQGNALITTTDYIGLGLSNALISIVVFFALSCLVKFLSNNNRNIPF